MMKVKLKTIVVTKAMIFISLLLAFSTNVYSFNKEAGKEKPKHPIEDNVYLQEVSIKIASKKAITSVVAVGTDCFAVMDKKLYMLDGDKLTAIKGAPDDVIRLFSEKENIWAVTTHGVFELQNRKWIQIDNRAFIDMTTHNGQVYAATKEELLKLKDGHFIHAISKGGYTTSNISGEMPEGQQLADAGQVKPGPIKRFAFYSGTLYILRPRKLVLLDNERKTINLGFIDWGRLPSTNTNDLVNMGNRMYIGTDRGLAELRGASLRTITGKDGLPIEATTCLQKGFSNDLWIGTEDGAIRMLGAGDFQYFSKGLWLPGKNVNDIAVSNENKTVYVATDEGIGVIHYEPFTLRKKAAWLERYIDHWGFKRMGFIHYLYKKEGQWIREITDNDGGHTAPYLVAMSYKYAVTGDEEARKEAVNSFKSMVWLQKITETDGLVARSIWSTGDKDTRSQTGSGNYKAHWHQADGGKFYWKGDVSSDEITAHFYAISLFHDLVAEGKLKEEAAKDLAKIASYIIKCGWTMHRLDGQPTRWARWNPEYLNGPSGFSDRGLNSLEVLSFMKAAAALTGKQEFKDAYLQLVQWGYPENTIRAKKTFPPEDNARWDDDLLFQAYMTLLRYAKDPSLRSLYLRSLERSWSILRIDNSPWFNFIYSELTGNDADFDAVGDYFRGWLLNQRDFSYSNSQRKDLFINKPGYVSYDGKVKILSSREALLDGEGRSPGVLDGDRNGNAIHPPTQFLQDYWMGRYYGFISPPKTEDADLMRAHKDYAQGKGAPPYDGPQRPEIFE